MLPEFKLNHEADSSGTSLRDHIQVAPRVIAHHFGKSNKSDGFKVSRSYTFEGKDGSVFTLYDWKCTSLYDPDYMTPESFWASSMERTFNIGARGDASHFHTWLKERVYK